MASIEYVIERAYPQSENFQELAMQVLEKFGEGNWFKPSNKDGQDYSICDQLHHAGIIARRRMPIWNENGLFSGYRIEFMWFRNMQYD